MKPLYVIVHEGCIRIDRTTLAGAASPKYISVSSELERIKGQELFEEMDTGPADKIPYIERLNRLISSGIDLVYVCGAYADVCVREHIQSLKQNVQVISKGIRVLLYEKASVSTSDIML